MTNDKIKIVHNAAKYNPINQDDIKMIYGIKNKKNNIRNPLFDITKGKNHDAEICERTTGINVR